MEPSQPRRTCPQCGQTLPPDAAACAKCGRDETNPFISPAAAIEPPTDRRLEPHWITAVIVVVFASIVIGVLVPGLGLLLGMVFVPASIRAAAVMRREAENASSPAKRIGYAQALFASAGVMFLVWLASTIAFSIICFPLGLISFDLHSGPGVGLIAGLILGFLSGLAVFIWLTRKYWPRASKD